MLIVCGCPMATETSQVNTHEVSLQTARQAPRHHAHPSWEMHLSECTETGTSCAWSFQFPCTEIRTSRCLLTLSYHQTAGWEKQRQCGSPFQPQISKGESELLPSLLLRLQEDISDFPLPLNFNAVCARE